MNKHYLVLFLLVVSMLALGSCSVSNNPLRKEIKLLQKGVIRDDTSYVYALPYEEGSAHRVVQGYFGPFSHKEYFTGLFK